MDNGLGKSLYHMLYLIFLVILFLCLWVQYFVSFLYKNNKPNSHIRESGTDILLFRILKPYTESSACDESYILYITYVIFLLLSPKARAICHLFSVVPLEKVSNVSSHTLTPVLGALSELLTVQQEGQCQAVERLSLVWKKNRKSGEM